MSFASLKTAVEKIKSEEAQVRAAAAGLVKAGYAAGKASKPEVHHLSVDRSAFRIYVWRDVGAFGDHVVLATGPSFEPKLALGKEIPPAGKIGVYLGSVLSEGHVQLPKERVARQSRRVPAALAPARKPAPRLPKKAEAEALFREAKSKIPLRDFVIAKYAFDFGVRRYEETGNPDYIGEVEGGLNKLGYDLDLSKSPKAKELHEKAGKLWLYYLDFRKGETYARDPKKAVRPTNLVQEEVGNYNSEIAKLIRSELHETPGVSARSHALRAGKAGLHVSQAPAGAFFLPASLKESKKRSAFRAGAAGKSASVIRSKAAGSKSVEAAEREELANILKSLLG